MFTKPMTAIAVVLAFGTTPLMAQEASGDAGTGADAGAEAGAADSGADAGSEAAAGAETDGAAGAEADASADAGAETEGDADAAADAGSGVAADATADSDAASETEASAVSNAEASGQTEASTGDTAAVTDPDAARIELGTLTCELEKVTNALIYATESFGCTFINDEGLATKYDGNIEKLGANLQIKTDQTMKWIVLSSVSMDEPEDLSGSYLGASAQASLGVGAGANVLVGGSGDNFTLQPISVTGQEGLGASLTLDSLTLSKAAY